MKIREQVTVFGCAILLHHAFLGPHASAWYASDCGMLTGLHCQIFNWVIWCFTVPYPRGSTSIAVTCLIQAELTSG